MPAVAAILTAAAPIDAGSGSRRPAVDIQAMREAMGVPAEEAVTYPSAASYAHFLRARLAHHDGLHREALDELRLALASDDTNPYLMTQLAEQYARLADLERAEAQLKKVVERHPGYAPAQLMMGRVLYEAGRTTRARAHLTRAIRLRPSDADAYLVLTQLWLDQGRVNEAVAVVEELGAAIPGDPVGYRRLGLALAERGDAVRAERLLARATERDPGDSESWVALARLAEAGGQLPRALELYGRALENDSDNKEVLLSAGRLALRLDRPVEARAFFDQLLSLGRDPEAAVKVAFALLSAHQLGQAAEVLDLQRRSTDEPRLHYYAGLVHERLRAWARAAEAFDSVPKSVGEMYFEARLHRAMSLSAAGHHARALEGFRKVSEERPELAALEPAWARALERAGQTERAEALLLKALAAAASPSSELLDAVAGFYGRQGRGPELVKLLTALRARRPEEEAVVFALATALTTYGDWRLGVERVRELLAATPANTAAMNFIGYTLAEHGVELAEAERLVKKALEARPDSAAYLDSMGWVYLKKGDLDRALELLNQAVAESPEEPTLLEHLGEARRRLGQTKGAAEAWTKALRIVTESPDAADRPHQRSELERKLKFLSGEAAGR